MRNIVVTGASRGLGLVTAETLAKAGFRVIAIARSEGKPLAKLRAEHGEKLAFCPCDLGALDQLAGLARTLRKEFGPIYGLVNNAGIGTAGLLSTLPDGKIEELVRINLTSPMLLTKYVLRSMLQERAGRIVNMSSIVATSGARGLSAYAATKAALIGFTRSLARDVGELGITVNAVAPGFTSTEMTDSLSDGQREQIARRSALRRTITAEDVAQTVEFLMSDKAGNITGTVLTVDAGATA